MWLTSKRRASREARRFIVYGKNLFRMEPEKSDWHAPNRNVTESRRKQY
jgi:hypothetical protein